MSMRKLHIWLGMGCLALLGLTGCEEDALREEVNRQKTIIMAQAKENQDILAQNEKLAVQLSEYEAELGGRDRKIAVLRQGIDRLKQSSVLSDKVQKQLEILVEKLGGTLIGNRLQLPGDYLFPAGRFTLTKASASILGELATILKGENLTLLIVGHTDSDPISKSRRLGIKSNRHLSLMRALAVMDELGKNGYPSDRMYPTGWGSMMPIADNKTKAGKALNRRVEILIDPAASGLFPISAIYDVQGPAGGGEGVVVEK